MTARERVLCVVAIGASVLSAGCSLLGLDRLNLPQCTANSDCAQVNTADGIAAGACMLYQCQLSTGACVLGPLDNDGDGDPPIACGGTDCDDNNPHRAGPTFLHETCDGIDNDCNEVIDDTAIRPRTSAVTGLTGLTAATYSAAPMGTAGFTFVFGGQPGLNVLQGPSATPATPQPTAFGYQVQTDPSSALLQPMLAAPGCDVASPGGTPPVMSGTCGVSDLALAPADTMGDWFVAAVNTMGCGAGQLRIGFTGTATAQSGAPYPDIILRGPPARSNVYLGVDTAPADNYCTGQSQTVHGAAQPSVGSLLAPGVAPQGLVAFLGTSIVPFQSAASAGHAACGGGGSYAVEAIGVWLASGMSGGETIQWATGTNSGTPQVLGMTMGGGRPAIASWTGASAPGWFVGYGNAAGHVAVQFVSGLGAAPTAGTVAYTPVTSSPLTVDSSANAIPNGGAGPADYVAMAVGHGDATSTNVGVTWIEGCNSASPSLYFARAHYVPGGTPEWPTVGTPVLVSATPSAGAPTIAYVSDGFLMPGFTRNGSTAAVGSTGGWLIAWTDSTGHVLAQRVAELDAQLIVEPPINLSAATAQSPRLPFVYPNDDANPPLLLRFAYIDGAGSATGGDLLCGHGTSL